MKKTLFICCLLFLLPVATVFSQLSEGGLPFSFNANNLRSSTAIPEFKLQTILPQQLRSASLLNGTPLQYSVVQNVAIDLKEMGIQSAVDLGTTWRLRIVSDSALSLQVFFSKFSIPAGATLFLYNSDYSIIFGAFTQKNSAKDSTFTIADFPGNSLVVEYFEPFDAATVAMLEITQVAQAYKNVYELMGSSEATDESPYIDVNCDEGKDWQLEKHAVCKYTFIKDGSGYMCSGALINNSNNDGTPYFLTASHCVSETSVAATVVAYFNYETLSCGLARRTLQTLSGSLLETTDASSDFTLLRFNNIPPPNYQPFYAGWDLSDSPTKSVGIHHPLGKPKMISIDNNPPVSYGSILMWENINVSPTNSHWKVVFDKGETAGGSSGSPLFNQNKRIIGQLHGGVDNIDYYGKLNYSWTVKNGNYSTLKSILAGNSNTTYMDGYFPSNNSPDAFFYTPNYRVCLNAPIQFRDSSLFNATFWEWTFYPNSYSFVNGSDKNSQHPTVNFSNAGEYAAKLVVGNFAAKDSLTIEAIINVGASITLSYESDIENGSCLGKADTVLFSLKGANEYSCHLTDSIHTFFNVTPSSSSKITVTRNNFHPISSTTTLSSYLKGVQGTCTDSMYFSYNLIQPENDNIASAKPLNWGKNGPFTNICATVEENEPHPTCVSCISNMCWCDENKSGLCILNNSVWFTVKATKKMVAEITTEGIDGQIALYEADSSKNILSGEYVLLAANDNNSSRNTNARIVTNLSPEKNYWLQFDGSNNGAEGTFYLTLNEIQSTTEPFILYPQPASDFLQIESQQLVDLSIVEITIFSSTGNVLFGGNKLVTENKVKIELDKTWQSGVYIIHIKGNGIDLKKQFIKQS